MRKLFTMTAAVVALAAVPLTAQPPDVKPGPEHAFLKEWEGTWDGTFKGPDGDSKCTSAYKVELNGLWVLEHFKADLGGKAFEGLVLFLHTGAVTPVGFGVAQTAVALTLAFLAPPAAAHFGRSLFHVKHSLHSHMEYP